MRWIVAAVIAAVCVLAASPAPAAGAPTSARIVWLENFQDQANIRIANSDGSGATTLISTGRQSMPKFSPDGKRIAYHAIRGGNTDVYVINANGTNERRVTYHPGQDSSPTWSPDGTRLAFHTDRNGSYDVFSINVDGTGEAPVVVADSVGEWLPSWSPDGTRIAFSATTAGGDWEIWVANTDGSGLTQLTNNAHHDLMARWSPSGDRLLYQRQLEFTSSFDVWVMNSDGSGETRLTTDASADGTPAWSPDGSRIAFSSNRSGNPDLWTMNANGSGQARLLGGDLIDQFPDYQPPMCTIASVIDGDTFTCSDGTTVEMLQIDAPELTSCGGEWAKAALQFIFLTPGREVALSYDTTVNGPAGSIYAAPIWLGNDGAAYNLSIVMAYVGLARRATVGAANDKYINWASSSEAFAQAAQWNMWAPGQPFASGC
jgi:Tol biopolymer transport system component